MSDKLAGLKKTLDELDAMIDCRDAGCGHLSDACYEVLCREADRIATEIKKLETAQ